MADKPVLGAQLYTVREFTKTLPDVEKTLRRVRKIGYTEVQLSGIGPVDPRELAKVLRDTGVKAVATHESWSRFLGELDAVVEEHRLWNCTHAAIGGLPREYHSEEGLARFLSELKPVSAALAKAGMDFSYHNHNHEFAKFGGRTWISALYESASPELLKAELDTYWVQAGGADPVQWIRKCAGREPLLHLKDMEMTPDRQQRFAPIGEGNLNWPGILKAAEEGGVKHLLVEQDNSYERDPFDALAVSHRFLSGMGYR
jgi:sugar phosphate isomerase/epimerase